MIEIPLQMIASILNLSCPRYLEYLDLLNVLLRLIVSPLKEKEKKSKTPKANSKAPSGFMINKV